ncbi:hypothetical protein FJZ31_12140 [Candidatus Poribacteria bacterium]|nr:hypothetical protein [Candidatus Poribacteria bacterium]
MKKVKIMDDTEIRIRGIEALNNALGSAAALRFLTLLHCEPTDYVEISRRLYKGQTINEIFERAKKQWIRKE